MCVVEEAGGWLVVFLCGEMGLGMHSCGRV